MRAGSRLESPIAFSKLSSDRLRGVKCSGVRCATNSTTDLADISQNGGRRRRNIIAAAGVAAVLAIIVTVIVVSAKDDSRSGTYVNCNNDVGNPPLNCYNYTPTFP
ncbi:MAG: hypothetical protein WCK14_15085 [Actinomycetota bacterium]